MKVALLIPKLTTGGAQRVIVNLANGLSRKNYEVDVVVDNKRGRFCSKLSNEVTLADLNAQGILPIWPRVSALSDYLSSEQPDVLFSALSHANVAALIAKKTNRNCDTRIVVSNHCPSKFYYRKQPKVRATLQLVKRTYPWADGIIVVSKGAAEDLHRLTNIPREQIDIVYNPVVTEELIEKSREDPKHEWLQQDSSPVVMSMGGMEEVRSRQKNFDLLLEAFKATIQDLPSMKLTILGKGDDRKRLEEKAKCLSIGDNVSFPGFVENPFSFLRNSSVFVLPSRYEGFGNVIVEAMACGCPVVATNCNSGPAEILGYGEYGKIVSVEDPDEMSSALRSTLENPLDSDILTERANEFSVDNKIDDWESAIIPEELRLDS